MDYQVSGFVYLQAWRWDENWDENTDVDPDETIDLVSEACAEFLQ
jgi:hypothetical protein